MASAVSIWAAMTIGVLIGFFLASLFRAGGRDD